MNIDFIKNLKSFDEINIKINNWEKYNEKRISSKGTDASYQWFKLKNDYLLDEKIIQLNDSAIILHIALLSLASIQNREIISTNLAKIRTFTGQREDRCRTSIGQLQDKRVIQVLDFIECEKLYKENRIEENRIERDTQSKIANNISLFDFEPIWSILPEGSKQLAKKRFEKYITVQKNYDDLLKATMHYVEFCKTKNQYLKHLSTFIGTERTTQYWKEFIEKPNMKNIQDKKLGSDMSKFLEESRKRNENARTL